MSRTVGETFPLPTLRRFRRDAVVSVQLEEALTVNAEPQDSGPARVPGAKSGLGAPAERHRLCFNPDYIIEQG